MLIQERFLNLIFCLRKTEEVNIAMLELVVYLLDSNCGIILLLLLLSFISYQLRYLFLQCLIFSTGI